MSEVVDLSKEVVETAGFKTAVRELIDSINSKDSDSEKIGEVLDDLSVRDGALWIFTRIASNNVRVAHIANVQDAVDRLPTDGSQWFKDNLKTYAAAVYLIQAGMLVEDSAEPEVIDGYVDECDKIINEVTESEKYSSFARLISMARKNEVPIRVLLDSIVALKWEDISETYKGE